MSVKGTGICLEEEIVLVETGEYLYSIRMNSPSGGTNDNALSRVQRCNLSQENVFLATGEATAMEKTTDEATTYRTHG